MPRGNKYFLLLVDDLSRYMWVVVIPSKDRADEAPTEESSLPVGASDTEVDNDIDDENMDADHDDDAPLYFRSMSDILTIPGFTLRALVAEELHVVSSDELTSFAEV
jgi:hypothetical protein